MLYGLSFLSSLVDNEEGLYLFSKFGLKEDYFQGDEVLVYSLFVEHISNYKKLPDRQTVKDTKFWGSDGDTPIKVSLDPVTETPEYYYDKMVGRYTERSIKRTLMTANEYFNKDNYDACVSLFRECLLDVNLVKNKRKVVDYASEAALLVVSEFNKAKGDTGDGGIALGWPSFDNMCGGLVGGDVISFIGRPAMGKSYQLLYSALNMWGNGLTPLFFSMEMKPMSILQRLTAMDVSLPITGLKKGELSTQSHKKMVMGLQSNMTKQPFWVIDGALSATMEDIELLSIQLNPDVIFIDGAYLIRHDSQKMQRWDRLTLIAEGIKQRLAEDLDLPVVISYQFNRQADKKNNSKEIDLSDIAYTDAIGQLSSVVLGILEEDGIETLARRKIKVLKGRDGQTGEFSIKWNFDVGPNFMDFGEVIEIDEDLEYL